MRIAVATILAVLALAAPAAAAPELVQVGLPFGQPMHVAAPPGDTRLFVVEKVGTVQVVKDGKASLFLDIKSSVRSQEGERGLLSIAFPPDYAASGRFYVYFTNSAGDIVIAEYQRRATNPDEADPATRRDVLIVAHPINANHNGGQLQFGADGMLYAGTGDGGAGNDPPNNAQNLDSPLGKLLRLDPHPSAGKGYTVPAGNPFSGSDARNIVWSYGLRNPWRFTFDRANHDLWIGDVGQNAWEEVDHAPAGLDGTPGGRGYNWGWRCFEATHQNTSVTPQCDPADDTAPVYEYPNPTGGQSVIGGYVVRDTGLPSLAGRYLFADAYKTDVRQLDPATGAVGDTGLRASGIVSFGEDACGRILVVTQPGPVYRIREAGGPDPPCVPPPPGSGPPPPGGTAPPPGGSTDRRAPKLSVALGTARTLVATGRLRPRLSCDEPCVVRARIAIAGLERRVSGSASVGPGSPRRLTVKLTRMQRGALRRALRRRSNVTLRVTFRATDPSGNASTLVKRVRLRNAVAPR